jgi:hypothetical protein
MAHPQKATLYPDDRFTDEELAVLQAEPMLSVEQVEEGPAGNEALLQDLVAAAKVAVDEGKTIGSGKPDIKAMSEILGRDVSAEERDRAWDALNTAGGE